MSYFTDDLSDEEIESEREKRFREYEEDDASREEYWAELDHEYERKSALKYARWCLAIAKARKSGMDVSSYVEDIRDYLKNPDASLNDLGTNEEELDQLVQTGCKSEALDCLMAARGVHGYSRIHLYVHDVISFGKLFIKRPRFLWLKLFFATVFCFRIPNNCRYYTTQAREYLRKGSIPLAEIGTDEAELHLFES